MDYDYHFFYCMIFFVKNIFQNHDNFVFQSSICFSNICFTLLWSYFHNWKLNCMNIKLYNVMNLYNFFWDNIFWFLYEYVSQTLLILIASIMWYIAYAYFFPVVSIMHSYLMCTEILDVHVRTHFFCPFWLLFHRHFFNAFDICFGYKKFGYKNFWHYTFYIFWSSKMFIHRWRERGTLEGWGGVLWGFFVFVFCGRHLIFIQRRSDLFFSSAGYVIAYRARFLRDHRVWHRAVWTIIRSTLTITFVLSVWF